MNETNEKTTEVSNELKCKDCGSILKFAPGTLSLKCDYCGAQNEIVASDKQTVAEEIDFEKFIASAVNAADMQTVSTVKCESCGASTTLKENVTADSCPFCGTSLVVKSGSTSSIIKPKYLLPFKVDQKNAFEDFRKWIDSLWFAPGDLKQYATNAEKLAGLYIPYWTYDSNTGSSYSGMRGMNYVETYTVTVNGRTETRTRTKIIWTPASGHVSNAFDDVLVMASRSLPEKYADALEPWDLKSLTDFSEKFLSGFRSETYQVDVKAGFGRAKDKMEVVIRETVRRDIGGDHQQILTLNTSYSNITFKHILLPIWISAFRYNNKVYRFMINGRTGEVQGERPWSVIKIVLTVIAGLAVLAATYFLFRHK